MCDTQIKSYDHAIGSNVPKYPVFPRFFALSSTLGLRASLGKPLYSYVRKNTHHIYETAGMIPNTCWYLEHCREKRQPTISKATVSVLHWYGSMKIILHTTVCQTWPVSKGTGLFYVSMITFVHQQNMQDVRIFKTTFLVRPSSNKATRSCFSKPWLRQKTPIFWGLTECFPAHIGA